MIDYLQELIQRYANKGAIIDSNLFLLLIVELIDPALIERNKRTRVYKILDFKVLCQLLRNFSRLYTTPNVVTEVSNLTNSSLSGDTLSAAYQQLASQFNVLDEKYLASAEAVKTREFTKFGLADTVMVELVDREESSLGIFTQFEVRRWL